MTQVHGPDPRGWPPPAPPPPPRWEWVQDPVTGTWHHAAGSYVTQTITAGIYYESTLQSERIIRSAPISFAGATVRIWRATQTITQDVARVFVQILTALILLPVAWAFVAAYYLMFGWFVWLYRIPRRRRVDLDIAAARHREQIAAQQQQMGYPPR